MTTTARFLAWGDNAILDDLPNVTFAWGARAIVTADGHVDFPPGRSDRYGDPAYLDSLAVDLPSAKLVKLIRDALLDRRLDTRKAGRVELHRDAFVVSADTKASAGYVYVTAYLALDEYAPLFPTQP